MKTSNKLIIGGLMLATAILMNGCVTQHKQVYEKSTIFGADAKSPGPSGTTIELAVGLIRNVYFSNPVNSNGVAATFHSTSHGDVGLFNQKADESFGTSQPPEVAYMPAPISTAYPLAGQQGLFFIPQGTNGGTIVSIVTNLSASIMPPPASAFDNGVTPKQVPADLTPAPRVGLPTTKP